MTTRLAPIPLILVLGALIIATANAFFVQSRYANIQQSVTLLYSKRKEESSSYDTSEASSKGIVSTLTGMVNFVMGKGELDVENKNGASFYNTYTYCMIFIINVTAVILWC